MVWEGRMKNKCENCKRSFKVLTEEGLCAYCFKEKHGYWSDDFCSDEERERRAGGGKRT